ncbi:ABC transporter permease [Kaistella antarctica]|uniref:Lipoprotein-releasing system transmembrane protein lolE n=1 Tax=Kaistella antarctica TaxID=266748 RepID=A0A448NQ09_9FLAO|nr:ABC transporter permease [Kaistella antarctica]KEY19231.1 permease [Kaistella antarctica]SEW04363.1 lipoprotein-releasing system permease protein [Kaistella antarctica]VEH98651.1 Lipoprotein-releasing system transmembrane protein lolE [Kaistella antarctica]
MKNTSFYIATRYLLARKGSTAVTFITWLAALAMLVAVAAMFIIISVFSGLEDLNQDLIANLHSDLTVKNKSGKVLQNIDKATKIIGGNKEIAHYSKVIEEKAYLRFRENGDIANLRGVDSAYIFVNPINQNILYGTYPSFKFSNEVLMENKLNNRLTIPVGEGADYATILMPKPGVGMISKEEDIFTKREIFVSGIFPGNDQLDNTIIAPIELARELLNLPKDAAYQIVIKLKDANKADEVKADLSKLLGKTYELKTKKEENAAFWKMINTEKLFIYLIFALVIFITTFNLAGAITILQLDKKEQAKSLMSMGMNLKSLRNVYFYTGLLIVFFGIISGLIVGTIMCYVQINTGFFKAGSNTDLAFPVRIIPLNYVIVSATAGVFGLFVSRLFSKVNKSHFKAN